MRHRMNVYFPPELVKQIANLADRKKLSRSAIVEAAVASFLSPDGADRHEAAFTRRLDRLSRQVQRLERNPTPLCDRTISLVDSIGLVLFLIVPVSRNGGTIDHYQN